MKMSIEKKIGQLLMFGFNQANLIESDSAYKYLQQGLIGGVILYDYNCQTDKFGDKNIVNPKQLRTLIEDIYRIVQNSDIPMIPFIAVDCEGGAVNRLKTQYGFEDDTYTAKELGRMPMGKVYLNAQSIALRLKDLGFNINFAPVVDLDINDKCPIIGKLERSYSLDPTIVVNCAQQFIKAHKKVGVACAIKHFPGHGSSETDSHYELVDVTTTWKEQELHPYRELIQSDTTPELVMTGHVINRNLDKNNLPATLSKFMLTNILRNELKYNGIIITDDLTMKALTSQYTHNEIAVNALMAGADVLLYSDQFETVHPQEIISYIVNAIDTGVLNEDKIDKAFIRVSKLKKYLQRFHPFM